MKLPTSYIPQEDMGYFMTSVQLPTGASLDRTDKVVTSLADQIKKIPEVDNVISISGSSMMGGGSGANMGSLFVVLKPWSQRKGKGQDVDAIMAHVSEIAGSYQEPIVFSINPPAIPGLGMTSGMQMQILDINNLGADALQKVLAAMKEAAKKDDRIAQLTTQYQAGVPQYAIKVDRDKAKLLGLSVDDIYSTLAQFMGGSYVNDFVKFGRTYQVNLSADSESRSRIGKLGRLSVRNANGNMVPFSSFISIEPAIGQSTVSRYNMYTTALSLIHISEPTRQYS